MKYLSLLFFLILVGCTNVPTNTGPRDIAREQMFISNTSSYFCVGNKNFLPCINPEVELESKSCTEYVVQNSRKCASKFIHGADLADGAAKETIGVEFTQCAMVEMLEREGVGYSDFKQCFNDNYSESAVHQKLNQ
ncbi:MAG: hypothetical protein CMG80_07460 [Marinobacter sp.]|nr:hypothetical protein [Marinobacter sp.]